MEQVQQKSWFKRNWLWFVPTMGCLTLIVLFFLGIGSLILGVTSMISDSEPAQYALEKASTNPIVLEALGEPIEKDGMASAFIVTEINTSRGHSIVLEALGEPIEKDGMASGSINFSNDEGSADLKIPISGPKGSAVIRVVAEKYDDSWNYEKLYVFLTDLDNKVDLITGKLDEP